MEKRFITEEDVERYGQYLAECEKSRATIQKYQYYLTLFQRYVAGRELKKKQVVQWKEDMKRCLAAVTVNGAISALNGFFRYKGWDNYTTKFYKIGRQIFCPEQKELEKWEYERLVNGARSQGDERMVMVMQTIAATGIRVSELPLHHRRGGPGGRVGDRLQGTDPHADHLTAKLCRACSSTRAPRHRVRPHLHHPERKAHGPQQHLAGDEAPRGELRRGGHQDLPPQSAPPVRQDLL